MKIFPADSTNFNGRFRNNALLEKVLSSSGSYELEKFLEMLNRMETKNDGQEFCLRVMPQPMCGGDFLVLLKNEQMIPHMRLLQIWEGENCKIWNSVLSNIIGTLNRYYPPPKPQIEVSSREKVLRAIYKKLDANV